MNSILDEIKKQMQTTTEDCSTALFALSSYIFHNPEMAFEETKATQAIKNLLEQQGLAVKCPVGGLDTAFCAEYCPTGIKAPVIAILAEYDALSIGHACGHNIIAAAGVGAMLAVKAAMEQYKIAGTIRIVGTPAEESGGGKIILQKAGVFDDVDSLLLIHPTSGMTKIAGNCKSSYKLIATYQGKAAHAGSHPEDGINAADAAQICYTAIGCLRNQLPGEVQVMPTVLEQGSENGLIPDKSVISINIRCFKLSHLQSTAEKVKNCMTAGAVATGCTMSLEEHSGYQGRVCSHILEQVVRNNFALLGEPVMEGMVEDNGGEDFGNLNRVIPGIMPYPSLLPTEKISNHTPQFRELANSPKAQEVILLGSRVMAYSAIDLFCNPQLIQQAKAELSKMQNSF